MLYDIIVAPIEQIVDWAFLFFYQFTFEQIGIIGAIIGVSLVINFLALPIYNVADSIQNNERILVKKMDYRVKRIKKAFKGDEQFLMLQTYYKQNNYNPIYVLRGSITILIQIPFFMAAYNYLSKSELLFGESFWIFKDLSNPDCLFQIKLFSLIININVLPILMTLINFISGFIYTKGLGLKDKIQVYGVAVVFLALLYNSPAGLVIYWILNNLFSLFKNAVKKLPRPGLILYVIILISLIIADIYSIVALRVVHKKVTFILTTLLLVYILFGVYSLNKNKIHIFDNLKKIIIQSFSEKKYLVLLLVSGIAITFLYGLVIPSNVISSSPYEFSNLGNTTSPLIYIKSAVFFFIGLFIFWPIVLYKMFGKKVKIAMPFLFILILVSSLCNVFVCKTNYGKLNYFFLLEDSTLLNNFSLLNLYLPILVIFVFLFLLYLAIKYNKLSLCNLICVVVCVGELFLGFYKIKYINDEVNRYVQLENINQSSTLLTKKVYNLSKTENNVVVLFLDRCVGSYFSAFLEDFPEYKDIYSGFVYYPNTVSFGASTINGFPPITGGYEYNTINNYLRNSETLLQKHNEASLVLPKLFLDAGYSVTVTDPSWPNYANKGDFTAYSFFPEINVSDEIGKNYSDFIKENNIDIGIAIDLVSKKQVKNFAILQTLYLPLKKYFYYTAMNSSVNTNVESEYYLKNFVELSLLSDKTDFTSTTPTFSFIENEITHHPCLLDSEYVLPSDKNEKQAKYNPLNDMDKMHYEVNVAAYLQVAKYINFLKDNDIYDNTRLIIVSDHGTNCDLSSFRNFSKPMIPAMYNPILLIKDFSSNDTLKVDDTFMTNADTMFLAKKDLDVSNFNPFTNKEFVQEKDKVVCMSFNDKQWNAPYMKNKTTFDFSKVDCWEIKNNIFNENNWNKIDDFEKYIGENR